MRIRFEEPQDIESIRELNRAAFGSDAEAALVDELRKEFSTNISLVAEVDGGVVGHIFFSPVVLQRAEDVRALSLSPLAVSPPYQRQGIGAALVEAGLIECRRSGAHAVFVLGHAAYYARFGFERASLFGIHCEFAVPDEAYFAMELVPGSLSGKPGTVRYPAAFRTVTGEL